MHLIGCTERMLGLLFCACTSLPAEFPRKGGELGGLVRSVMRLHRLVNFSVIRCACNEHKLA